MMMVLDVVRSRFVLVTAVMFVAWFGLDLGPRIEDYLGMSPPKRLANGEFAQDARDDDQGVAIRIRSVGFYSVDTVVRADVDVDDRVGGQEVGSQLVRVDVLNGGSVRHFPGWFAEGGEVVDGEVLFRIPAMSGSHQAGAQFAFSRLQLHFANGESVEVRGDWNFTIEVPSRADLRESGWDG